MSISVKHIFGYVLLFRHPYSTGKKTVGPSQILSFAGVELASCLMEARLPLDKFEKCIAILSDFLKRKRVTLKEIQSLNGLLNFACSVIVPGRAFLRRLIDLTIGVRSPKFSIRLTRSVKEDLNVWLSFLAQYNRKSLFLPCLEQFWQA